MTVEEELQALTLLSELKEIADRHGDDRSRVDIEGDHSKADRLLCDLLLLHGESDAVINFRAIRKWYA